MNKKRLLLPINRKGLLEKKLPTLKEPEEDAVDRENDELWFTIINRIKRLVRSQRKSEPIDPQNT